MKNRLSARLCTMQNLLSAIVNPDHLQRDAFGSILLAERAAIKRLKNEKGGYLKWQDVF